MARRWFSNCDVAAPSIVQCPELCTRGAISFASGLPLLQEELDRQHSDIVHLLQQPDHDRFPPRAAAMPALVGRDRAAQDAVAVEFSVSG